MQIHSSLPPNYPENSKKISKIVDRWCHGFCILYAKPETLKNPHVIFSLLRSEINAYVLPAIELMFTESLKLNLTHPYKEEEIQAYRMTLESSENVLVESTVIYRSNPDKTRETITVLVEDAIQQLEAGQGLGAQLFDKSKTEKKAILIFLKALLCDSKYSVNACIAKTITHHPNYSSILSFNIEEFFTTILEIDQHASAYEHRSISPMT